LDYLYSLAARFQSLEKAGETYFPIQQIIFIEAELIKTDVLVTIREDALRYLQDRRAQATQLGSWVKGHYQHPEET